MRIGISTSVVQRGRSGVAQYLFALLRALLPATAQHQIILFVLEDDLPLFTFARDFMAIVSVPEKYRSPVTNILWHQTQLPQLARQHQLDVLHIPSYRRMLWSRPCALVATIHDLAPFHVANKYDWKRMIYGRVIARRLACRQHEIIAISQSTAHDVQQFFHLTPEKLTVIHNGIEHERFYPGPNGAAKAPIAQRGTLQQPFFLYVARLEHPAKNHVRLISAFNRFKAATQSNWQMVFGGSDWHGAEAIHAAVRQSPFTRDIRLLGFVPDDALPNLYRAADVFIYPSLFEGFGMPPLEAMACGCPVISSTRGSLAEVIGDAAVRVTPESTDSMAEQLAALARDPDLRVRLRTAGLAQARKFDWNRTAAETLTVYERAVARLKSTRANRTLPSQAPAENVSGAVFK
jgi:glycosyltransferase involved in cell wall biosynthesis